jgi:hypothetical protein
VAPQAEPERHQTVTGCAKTKKMRDTGQARVATRVPLS